MDNQNRWASVSTSDGLIFEGTVEAEMPYGIYIYIGGDSNRLNLFPWNVVSRVTYKKSGS